MRRAPHSEPHVMASAAAERKRTTVLLIAGTGRSGSTLLANILGQVPGYFCAGELRFIWERGLAENRLCGCGDRFRDCPVWRAVLDEAIGGMEGPAAAQLAGVRVGGRVRHVPMMLMRREAWVSGMPGADRISNLYQAIGGVTGCDVVVDSSKLPAYGSMLDATPGIDLFIVHLVRDPRAAAFSWARRKLRSDGDEAVPMERFSPLKSALLWDLWNLTGRALWRHDPSRYVLLRYEDLIERPGPSIRRILEMMGHAGREPSFAGGRSIDLAPTHTVSGNPSRLRPGPVELRPDDEWTTRMRRRDRTLVTAMTAPFLRGFGYAGRTRLPSEGDDVVPEGTALT